jgi:hypothetical protein
MAPQVLIYETNEMLEMLEMTEMVDIPLNGITTLKDINDLEAQVADYKVYNRGGKTPYLLAFFLRLRWPF